VSVCLDSWAVLAWLDGDEPAAGAVQEAFDAERPWMSWLNIGEVAYQLERRHGADEAGLVVGRLRASVALDDVTPGRVLAAAHIKAAHRIAFADCFAAATALARQATLFTGDPELLDRDVGCDVRDLRAVSSS
jgi:predicted nucleic acid-binding protein